MLWTGSDENWDSLRVCLNVSLLYKQEVTSELWQMYFYSLKISWFLKETHFWSNSFLCATAHRTHWQTTHWLPITPQLWYNLQASTALTNIIYTGQNWEKAGCCVEVERWRGKDGESAAGQRVSIYSAMFQVPHRGCSSLLDPLMSLMSIQTRFWSQEGRRPEAVV